jgi:hypothetical protein
MTRRVIVEPRPNPGPGEMKNELMRRCVGDEVQSDATSARDRRLERLIECLPWCFRSQVRRLRQPSSFWIRIPTGVLLDLRRPSWPSSGFGLLDASAWRSPARGGYTSAEVRKDLDAGLDRVPLPGLAGHCPGIT